jgi:hypothetical protein
MTAACTRPTFGWRRRNRVSDFRSLAKIICDPYS